MSRRPIFSFLSLSLLFTACKITQPIRPMEKYLADSLKTETSIINIPIQIGKTALQENLNRQLGEVLYEDSTMQDDQLMIRAIKKEDVVIAVDSQAFSYRVPLDLWIKKGWAITDFEAEGELELQFITRYEIQENWKLETHTEVAGYQWLSKPVLKLGFVDLPIKFIANKVLERTKETISNAIDEQVAAFFDLHAEIEKAWSDLHKPILLSEEYKSWLLINPSQISMTPLEMEEDTLKSTLFLEAKPGLVFGKKPTPPPSPPLPRFQFSDQSGTNFSLFIDTQIPFEEAERISRENLLGESFSFGHRTVKVETLELYGQGGKVVVNLGLSGSYKGHVYLIGKPKYNASKNKIELKELDFEFTTKKILLKTAAWLFKSAFKKQIQKNLNFYLNENLQELKRTIQVELNSFELANGVALQGQLDELNLAEVFVLSTGFLVQVGLKGQLNVKIEGLVGD